MQFKTVPFHTFLSIMLIFFCVACSSNIGNKVGLNIKSKAFNWYLRESVRLGIEKVTRENLELEIIHRRNFLIESITVGNKINRAGMSFDCDGRLIAYGNTTLRLDDDIKYKCSMKSDSELERIGSDILKTYLDLRKYRRIENQDSDYEKVFIYNRLVNGEVVQDRRIDLYINKYTGTPSFFNLHAEPIRSVLPVKYNVDKMKTDSTRIIHEICKEKDQEVVGCHVVNIDNYYVTDINRKNRKAVDVVGPYCDILLRYDVRTGNSGVKSHYAMLLADRYRGTLGILGRMDP